MYDRLRVALSEEGPPHEVLLRELPGAVLEELGRLDEAVPGTGAHDAYLKDLLNVREDARRGVIKVLINRVARRISCASIRHAGDVPLVTEQEQSKRDLEEFEREEESRRHLAELQEWTERAGLSEQQKRVHDLDLSTDYDTEAIASTLGITLGHVRKVRHDYKLRIRKAAGL